MKDIIIEAGLKLGRYFIEELGAKPTPTNFKKLCAASTDILPGVRYEAVRNMLSFGTRYGLATMLTDINKSERLRVNEAIYTLTTRALMADGFARMAVALFILILDDDTNTQDKARKLMGGGLVSELFSAQPKEVSVENAVTIPPEFRVKDGVLVEYLGKDESVTVPVGVTEIGEKVFASRDKIKCVKLPDGLLKIGDNAFSGAKNLVKVELPESLLEIGAGAFYSCFKLSEISLPRGLAGIGEYAFGECKKLPSANIPSGVTELPQGVFSRSGFPESFVAGYKDNLACKCIPVGSEMAH